jgi:hypothetical protein
VTSPAVRRRRLAAAAVALPAVAAVVVLAVRALGSEEPPATAAAKLAPKNTLVYVHVSTDTERDAVERAHELLGRFDSYERITDTILQRLVGTSRDVKAGDVEPWLGDEAALALVDAGQATAGSLVIVRVTDARRARDFLTRSPRHTAVRTYKGDRIDEFGTVNVAFKDGWLLIGQSITVQGALERADGRDQSLADDPIFRRAMEGAPEGRAADAYITVGGLRRLLAPQGDLLGGLATALDQPALQAVALSAEAEDDERLRITAHSILDAAAQKRSGGVPEPLDADLLEDVPEDALAYYGVRGISGALGNLLAAAAGGADAGGAGPVLQRLRRELTRQAGDGLERDLLRLFDGEVAVVITKAIPAPALSLVAKVADEERTAGVLRRLQAPLVRMLTPEGEQAPRWRTDDLGGGVRAHTLAIPSGAELSYAVFDGRLVLGTGPTAIRRIKDADGSLEDSDAFKSVERRSEKMTSLGFLDFSQLLELGEQTGLNDSRAYLAAREDLQRIRALGVSSYGSEGESTAEILLSIP